MFYAWIIDVAQQVDESNWHYKGTHMYMAVLLLFSWTPCIVHKMGCMKAAIHRFYGQEQEGHHGAGGGM